jgi:hypothetical protein
MHASLCLQTVHISKYVSVLHLSHGTTLGLRKVHLGAVDLAVQKERVRTKDNGRETKQNSKCRGRGAVASNTTGFVDGICGLFQLGENVVDVGTTHFVGVKVLVRNRQVTLAFGGILVALFTQLDQLIVVIVVVWWE